MLQKTFIELLSVAAALGKAEEFHPHQVRSILVVELSRLGDIMVMLPILSALQSTFHNVATRALVNQRYVSLLSAFNTGFDFMGFQDPGTVAGLTSVLRFVRRFPVDLAVSMSTPRRNVLATLASKSRYKLGYLSYVDSFTPFLLNTKVEAYGFSLPAKSSYGKENIYSRPVKILEALHIQKYAVNWRLELKPEIYHLRKERLITAGIIPQQPYVLLHPFSGWRYREWGLDRFVSLGNRIAEELDHSVLLVSENTDMPRMTASVPQASSIKSFGASDLLDVAILMKGASLVVGNDSGPLHLAASLGRPTVGLFGPASPSLTAPLNGRGSYLYQKVECSPCDQRRCIRPENPCMGLHTVDQVFRAVAGILSAQNVQASAPRNV